MIIDDNSATGTLQPIAAPSLSDQELEQLATAAEQNLLGAVSGDNADPMAPAELTKATSVLQADPFGPATAGNNGNGAANNETTGGSAVPTTATPVAKPRTRKKNGGLLLNNKPPVSKELKDVSLAQLRRHDDQIRSTQTSAEEDAHLRDSILVMQGILVPLIVLTLPERDQAGDAVHLVVDGNRRLGQVLSLVQSGQLTITDLPCIVYPVGLTPAEVLRLQYVINEDRSGLTPIDVATGLERIKKELRITSDNKLAEYVGRPQSWVSQCLRVARARDGADRDVYQAVVQGEYGIRKACTILAERADQRQAALTGAALSASTGAAADERNRTLTTAATAFPPRGYGRCVDDYVLIDEEAGLAIAVFAPSAGGRRPAPPAEVVAKRIKNLYARVAILARKKASGK